MDINLTILDHFALTGTYLLVGREQDHRHLQVTAGTQVAEIDRPAADPGHHQEEIELHQETTGEQDPDHHLVQEVRLEDFPREEIDLLPGEMKGW